MNSIWRISSLAGFLALAQLPAAQQQPADKQQRDLRIEKDAPAAPVSVQAQGVHIPRSYALVVGVANYQNLPASKQLQFPERDAEAVYSILISTEGGNFHAENVHKLVGAKATLAAVRHELEEWLPSVSKDNDRVLIYFAGHGFLYSGRAYLAPYDIDPNNIAGTGYPMDDLGAAIGSKIHAKSKILLTDSCHSGAIRPEDTQSFNRSLIDLQKSLFSLTASRDREQSFESVDWGGGHGIFTYYVVRGMEGEADENGDGIVTADELQDYVYRNVREATNGRQNPTSAQGSFDPQMLLAYVPSRARPGQPAAPKTGTFVVESNMDGVEFFLDGKSLGVVDKGKALTIPGLTPGAHTIKGVKMGYEPDGPREETVYPGQETTVSIKILYAKRHSKAALDAVDEGLKYYSKGFTDNYKKAAIYFEKALELDPTYSQAALYLGRTYNALLEEDKAEQYFRRAVQIDPDYVEAHASLAGMLLDTNNTDEAIRQLNVAVQRDPNHAMSWYLLAEAYRLKEAYPQSIEAAQRAIQLTPNKAEAHFWLGESLRMSKQYARAETEYQEYLKLSDFDSKLGGQLNYYVLGSLMGIGKKKRAGQQDIWKDLRSLAYFGLCDAELLQSHFDSAITYCQKSLSYSSDDPFAHFDLAMALEKKGQQNGIVEMLPAARQHFASMLAINSELAQADIARKNIANIDGFLKSR